MPTAEIVRLPAPRPRPSAKRPEVAPIPIHDGVHVLGWIQERGSRYDATAIDGCPLGLFNSASAASSAVIEDFERRLDPVQA